MGKNVSDGHLLTFKNPLVKYSKYSISMISGEEFIFNWWPLYIKRPKGGSFVALSFPPLWNGSQMPYEEASVEQGK